MIDKNYEGYSDQTAGQAIRNVQRKKHKKMSRHLTFTIGELLSFREWVRCWNR